MANLPLQQPQSPRDSDSGTRLWKHKLDECTEEKIKLLEDTVHLYEDVLQGLIHRLKLPIQVQMDRPLLQKEVLFPAQLICLITNQMWRFGLIEESERFLANVMHTIQAHVMARLWKAYYFVGWY